MSPTISRALFMMRSVDPSSCIVPAQRPDSVDQRGPFGVM